METNETSLDTYVIEIYGGHDTYLWPWNNLLCLGFVM